MFSGIIKSSRNCNPSFPQWSHTRIRCVPSKDEGVFTPSQGGTSDDMLLIRPTALQWNMGLTHANACAKQCWAVMLLFLKPMNTITIKWPPPDFLFLVEAKLLGNGSQIGRHEVLVRIQQRGCQCEDGHHVVALQPRYRMSRAGAHCKHGILYYSVDMMAACIRCSCMCKNADDLSLDPRNRCYS